MNLVINRAPEPVKCWHPDELAAELEVVNECRRFWMRRASRSIGRDRDTALVMADSYRDDARVLNAWQGGAR